MGWLLGYKIQLALVYRVYSSDLKEINSNYPHPGTNDWQFIAIVLKKKCVSGVGLLCCTQRKPLWSAFATEDSYK